MGILDDDKDAKLDQMLEDKKGKNEKDGGSASK